MPRPEMRFAFSLGLACVLAACSTTPSYQAPTTKAAAAFKEGEAFEKVFAKATPEAASVPDAWWELFADPVLSDLQSRVVKGNASLAANAAAVALAQAAVASSRASLWPTVGVSAGATRSNTGGGAGSSYNAQASVSSWEIDVWNRLGGAVSAAQAREQASQGDLASARLSVQASVAQTYFSLRAAEAQADVLERSLQALTRSLQLTQNRYQAGVASAVDVSQAVTQLKSAQAQALESRLTRAQLEHALATLLGVTSAEFSLAKTGQLPRVPAVPLQLPSQLLERRPDIAAAERRVAAANAQIGAADAAFFPALTLSASAGYRDKSLGSLFNAPSRIWSLGPSFVYALFDGGGRQAASDSARASYDQAVAIYRSTVLTALQEVEDNLVAAATLQEEEGLQQELVAAAQKTLQITNNQYSAGTVSYLNVVTAQSAELSAQTGLINVQSRRLIALNLLLKNIAGRWDLVVK